MIKEEILEKYQEIKKELYYTLIWGICIGIGSVFGYSFFDCNFENCIGRILFILILLASASFISGFFIGTLFSIPKQNKKLENEQSPFLVNNNLVEISDWLTKIIIGLGLIQLKEIGLNIQSIANYVAEAMNTHDNSIKIFTICCIIYFTVFGFYYGYNYMRLVLTGFYSAVQHKEPDTTEITTENFVSPENLGPKLIAIERFNEEIKRTKTEDKYLFKDWYLQGLEAMANKNFVKTIAYMENALIKNKSHENAPDAYLFMGVAYEKLELYVQGIKQDDIILENYKDYKKLYLVHANKGAILGKLKKFDDALKEFNISIALNDKHYGAWSGKGYVLAGLDKIDDAIIALNKGIELNPIHYLPYYNLACMYARKNDKTNMLYNLKKAIELNKESKDLAKKDLDIEFKEFKEDMEFKNLLE